MLVIHSMPMSWEKSVEVESNQNDRHEGITYAQNKLCHIGIVDGKYSERL